MRLYYLTCTTLVVLLLTVAHSQSRRVRVEPREDLETIQYYAAEPQQEEQHHQVVLVSAADQYNGLYGQPTATARLAQSEYIPASRKALPTAAVATARVKEPSRAPPVQTIRNYNKVNDDGSFTFGYEAADGSFKEETRGTDCVVRGKYGYVDPDGNKREFTYVSGNPCDPNAPKDDQDDGQDDDAEQEAAAGGPDNYPTRPIRPLRPITLAPKPAVTLFQNNYEQGEDEQPEPEQVLTRQQPVIRRPTYISRTHHHYTAPVTDDDSDTVVYQQRPAPQLIPSSTPSSVVYRQSVSPINITPRPLNPTPAATARSQLPATTYRPQLIQLAVTPRPALLYTKPHHSSTSPKTVTTLDFDSEFQKFQQENNIVAPTPSSTIAPKKPLLGGPPKAPPGGQIYSSALVYDPTSGQYNTQLYQTLPQTNGDFTLNHRIQPYVHQPQHHRPIHHLSYQLQPTAPPPNSPLYTRVKQASAINSPAPQALYQNQQAELQFQNSVQLLAQQQRARAVAAAQAATATASPRPVPAPHRQLHHHHPIHHHQQQQPRPQQLYYIQPTNEHGQPLSSGQIDAFLRGHNIAF